MKQKLLIFYFSGIFFCWSHAGWAQDNRIVQPKLAVKWSPLHLIYFYPSFQVALEHKLTQHVNLQYDLGWILNYPSSDDESFRNKAGFRGIVEARYYLPSPRKIPFYLAAEYYYSRVTFERSEVIGYGCESGDCDYFQYTTYQVIHHNQGAGMKFGLLLFPGWNRNKSFFFDINVGAAYRDITYSQPNLLTVPFSRSFGNDSNDVFAPSEKNHGEMRPVVGVRLGYRIF